MIGRMREMIACKRLVSAGMVRYLLLVFAGGLAARRGMRESGHFMAAADAQLSTLQNTLKQSSET